MYKYGLLEEGQNKLDYVLALTPQARARRCRPGSRQASTGTRSLVQGGCGQRRRSGQLREAV